MEHYEEKIERTLQWLKNPSRLSPTGNSPIVYLVYQPEDVMTMRNLAETFLPSKAKFYGFNTISSQWATSSTSSSIATTI